MYILAKVILCLFPIVALVFLTIGIKKNAIYFVISSLWISVIALIIHFQSSGGQILGSYFDYTNSAIYTLNLLILFISLIRVISHLSLDSFIFKYTSSFFKAFLTIGTLIVISNLWINAYFIENRKVGTPIMQVALFKKPDYCNYRYVFYKVAEDGAVAYLCPDHYGLIPSMGQLIVSPDFIATQFLSNNKRSNILMQQKKTNES